MIKVATVLMIVFLGAMSFANVPRHAPPKPNWKLSKLYPNRIEVFIGSNGRYYWNFVGYTQSTFSHETVEEAVEDAQGTLDRWKETDSRTYRIVETVNLD
ncbi:MAG: hypothetical protein DRI87_06130 [Bacteroidetes bacterium]|nr:MAG: hypothetical protein DRI87_06130 [Bacteroidota bacterium]